jgi:hypothetical protein
MMDLNRRRLAVAAVLLLVVAAGAVGAQTFLFTAGEGVTINSTNGPAVTLGEDLGLSGQNPTTSGDDGVIVQNTTITGPQGAATTLTGPSSNAPTLSSIDTAGGTLEVDTTGIQTVGVAGGITEVTYRDVDLQSDTTEFEVSGTGSIEIHGFAADEWVRVERVNGDDELVQADGSGVATVNVDSGADFTVVDTGGGPTLSNPSPTNDEQFSDTTVNLSVNVSDPDFSADESVDLQWYVDGSQAGTTTVTENGTATFEASVSEGGQHEWYVNATDREGNEATSGSPSSPHTFATPGTLYIRDESNPTQLLDGTNVEIRFYFGDDSPGLIVNRTASDGTIDMTGLPTNEPFVVVANTDGYYPRRIYKEDLIAGQSVYLLNESKEAVSPTFELIDYSGQFNAEDTVMLIQRGLANESGTIDWRTVQGDFFGANSQFPADLRFNVRHRLVLINTETGTRRVKGQYTPTADGLQEVVVRPDGTVSLQDPGAVITVSPSTRTLLAVNDTSVTVDIDSQVTEIESWSVTMTGTDSSGSSSTLYSTSGSGTGTIQPSLNLTGYGGGEVEVDVTTTLETGETKTETVTFTVRDTYDNEFALLSVLGVITTRLPGGGAGSGATTFAAMLVTVFGTAAVARAVPASTEILGLIALVFVAAFATVGWMSYDVLFITAIGFIAIAALRRGI